MEKMMLSEIADLFGKKIGFDAEVTEICTDTRTLKKNCVFVAIKGERFDAHDFVPEAIKQGAVACITEREIENAQCIVVESTRKAFMELSNYYRKKFNIHLVGVTGSVGKTTTKEMISLVLSKKFNTLKTQGNLNNEIGLPKTLFNLTSEHQSAVIEMGMSHFEEISRLSKTASPDIGVITNIGFSHIENLGSQEGILKAKLEILDGMSEESPLIINADDTLLYGVKNSLNRKVYTFGIENKDADFRASDISEYDGITKFNVIYENKNIPVKLSAVGKHNVLNALTAFIAGHILGIDDSDIASAFSEFVSDALRQNISEKNGQTVIIDCYNASPDSMKASFNVLAGLKVSGRKIAVLGDMLELGEMSETLHRKVGKMVVSLNPDMLFCYGKDSEYIADEAEKAGIKIFFSSDKNEVSERLADYVASGDAVLFKASRGMKLEEIVNSVYGEM